MPGISRHKETYVADNGLQIASMLDLAGTKVSVVQVRAELRDYIEDGNVPLLPEDVRQRLVKAATAVVLAKIPDIQPIKLERT